MRHVALEGRCFVLSACQHIRRDAYPDDYECVLGNAPDTVLMRGGSLIVSPLGELIAGPNYQGETILYADIDLDDIVRGKYDFDVVGTLCPAGRLPAGRRHRRKARGRVLVIASADVRLAASRQHGGAGGVA